MTKRILVINPNSNARVTEALDTALEELRDGVDIQCMTLDKGPFGIETDEDIRSVKPLVASVIANDSDYDAYVIACYSDPGLAESRTICRKPVLGIHESAVTYAASHEMRFGVVALSRDSIQRHIAYVRRLGLQSWHAGERPLDISVDEGVSGNGVLQRITDTGRQLVEEDGAQAVILGCAGLAAHRRPAQQALGVPVIDPVLAAVTMAIDASSTPH